MEWVDKLEAKSGWREVETTEVSRLERRAVGLAAGEAGLTLAEGKNLVGELARLILQTQMEEFTTCARVRRDCLKLRRLCDQRTRRVQTLFGTIAVDAPRISACPCRGKLRTPLRRPIAAPTTRIMITAIGEGMPRPMR